MQIVTNGHWRKVTFGFELPEDVKAEFDYLTPEELESRPFASYRGNWYDLGDIPQAPASLKPWQGFISDTAFSGVAFIISDDGEEFKAATVYA